MPILVLFALAVIISCWGFFKWMLLAFVLLVIAEGIRQSRFPTPEEQMPSPRKPTRPTSSLKRQGKVVFAREVRQVRNGKVVVIRPG